jgi:hypothetical protein
MSSASCDKVEHGKNRTKSKVRAKVEHPFLVIKRVFGCQSALSRVGEEHAPFVGELRSHQSVHRPASAVARLTGNPCPVPFSRALDMAEPAASFSISVIDPAT